MKRIERSFLDRPVPNEILVSLFEAARWAASCNNSQPWRFIVATSDDGDEYERMQSCVNERNQRWSRLAPVIGFVCAYKMMGNGKYLILRISAGIIWKRTYGAGIFLSIPLQ